MAKKQNAWHTNGHTPSEYPCQDRDMVHYLVLRKYPDQRYDIDIEPWVTDTDFTGKGIITPAHFSKYGNGAVIGWQALPLPITADPEGWMSPYRGDDDPKTSGMYLCTTTRDNVRFEVKEAYWDCQKSRWFRLREREEVIAWRKFPSIPSQAALASYSLMATPSR